MPQTKMIKKDTKSQVGNSKREEIEKIILGGGVFSNTKTVHWTYAGLRFATDKIINLLIPKSKYLDAPIYKLTPSVKKLLKLI